MKKKGSIPLPALSELEEELKREKYKRRYYSVFGSTVSTLIVVAAVAVLIATLWLPMLQVYGSSMAPTLKDGEIVFTVKTADPQPGSVIAFYYNNKILIKRVIAGSGDWVDIDDEGTVSVNGVPLDEPYLTGKAKGECDREFPCQVPEGKWFVMGDHRATSVDSRSSAIGFVAQEQIIGRISFRIWPLNRLGVVN